MGGKTKGEALYRNNQTYLNYFYQLEEIAINMYEWLNIPDSIDQRFIEWILFNKGYIVFFFDEVMERYLCLECQYGGPLDVYRIPKERRAYASNGYNYPLNINNSVIIFNNYLHQPTFNNIEMYARRLYEVERTIDVNINAQKTPVTVKGPNALKQTLLNMVAQYSGNEPFLYLSDKNDLIDAIQVLNTQAPFVADKLQDIKHQIYNEALTFLGIPNANTDKRERLISDEVNANNSITNYQAFTRLNARKQACTLINQMFGLSIDVRQRPLNEIMGTIVEGGEENVEVYDSSLSAP